MTGLTSASMLAAFLLLSTRHFVCSFVFFTVPLVSRLIHVTVSGVFANFRLPFPVYINYLIYLVICFASFFAKAEKFEYYFSSSRTFLFDFGSI